jgi:S1-C subfamily serine protease
VVRCAAGIAALCDETGATKGTGFLVRGRDLNPAWGEDAVLVSNAHVVSDPSRADYESEAPLKPATMRIVLEGAGNRQITCATKALWQSPIARHDAVVIPLTCSLPEGVQPLELAPRDLTLKPVDVERGDTGGAQSRVSVIGYPLGGPLSLSIVGSITGANGLLVDIGCRRKGEGDPTYLHYRAPTEPGNSGSPVFETNNWTVVGLHHEGFDQFDGRPRLDGKTGKSFANEGISIHSIARSIAGK